MSAASAPAPASLPAEVPGSGRSAALISPAVDFWLLGGFSLAVWCALRILEPFQDPAAPVALGNFARSRFTEVAGAAGIFAVLVISPHFMAGYRLAYGRGLGFVRSHWLALVLVPLGLLAALTLGVAAYGAGEGTGAAVMGILLQLMLFSVGWHYSKQAYGAVVVEAHYQGYPLDERQRNLVRFGLHGVWLAAWLANNEPADRQSQHGITWAGLGVPHWLALGGAAAALVLLGLVVRLVVMANRGKSGRLPGLAVVAPYLAFMVWWLPGLRQRDFHDHLVPIFHAVQYAPFVWRVERLSAAPADEVRRSAKLTLVALGLILAGAASFELVPTQLDHLLHTHVSSGAFLFTASFAVFLNLHHYFIDSVIWKMKDPVVRAALR